MFVNTNVSAFNAYRNLSVTEGQLSKSLARLSSGLRINTAADDAAGLVNSEALRSQIGGAQMATRNAQDGISVAQTADGALNEAQSILQRMRDLAVQEQNGANSGTATTAIDAEYSQLASELTHISTSTNFNGNNLLDGTYNHSFQIGAASGDTFSLDLSTVNLGTIATAVGTTASSIATVDTALDSVSAARGKIGSYQNRLEHTVANLGVEAQNLSASEARIRDTDVSSEMTNFSKLQILQQAGTAMLAQANSAPQSVLSLLKG